MSCPGVLQILAVTSGKNPTKLSKLELVLLLSSKWKPGDKQQVKYHVAGGENKFILDIGRPRSYFQCLVQADDILRKLDVREDANASPARKRHVLEGSVG